MEALLVAFLIATVGAQEFQSTENQTNMIELFTSEGCSSCPPADEWFARLRGSKGLWKSFVPMGFHVDYWNKLGWTDKYSRVEFTTRQQQYATDWRNWRVYTPAFVVNGEEWHASGGEMPVPKPQPAGVLKALLKGRTAKSARFVLSFTPAGQTLPLVRSFVAYGALLGNGLVSKIAAGENEGKSLNHEFVVLALKQQPLARKTKGVGSFEGEIELEYAGGAAPKSYSVAFWVSPAGQQRPVQAVGGELSFRD